MNILNFLQGDLAELGDDELSGDEGNQVLVGICAMAKKSQSKPMNEILTRLREFEYLKMIVFPEDVILKVHLCFIMFGIKTNHKRPKHILCPQKPVEEWPLVDCLISFHSKGFPLDKAIQYAQLRNPFIINNLHMQYDIQVVVKFLVFSVIVCGSAMSCNSVTNSDFFLLGSKESLFYPCS